jgi:hypothetical protein
MQLNALAPAIIGLVIAVVSVTSAYRIAGSPPKRAPASRPDLR